MKKNIRFLAALMLLPASLFAATIGGTVTTGATGGATGTPIADAKVVLIATGGGGGGAGTRLDSTATDATGKYSFTLDTTGFRQIQVTATGFNTGTGSVNAASDTGAYTVNVNLISSAPGTLEGKVTSDSAATLPIAGALVIVRRSTGGTFTPESTLTDSEGKYAFDSIPGNTGYTVAVSATGYVNLTRNNVAISATTTQNFVLLPTPAPGSIAGKVVKASDSSALAGARVILSRSGGGGGGFTPDTVLTDAQGAFAFDSIPVNSNYALSVSLAGYVNGTRNNLAVLSGETNTQTIALAPPPAPGSIAGKVVKATDSSALAGARVILSRSGGGGGGGFTPDTVTTNAQGAFAFDSVPVNTNYTLTVSLAGYTTGTRGNLAVLTGQTNTQTIALAVPIPPGSVAGKVTKASDAGAVSGATVILTRSGGGGGGGFTPDTVLTSATGEYAFDSIPNQNGYVVTVSAAGFSTTASNNVSVSGGLKTTVDIALEALTEGDTTGTIKGVVRKGVNDSLVPGARVILSRITGGGGGGGATAIDTVVSDANGAFSFPDLVAGNYRLNVSATGFQASQSGTLALAAGGTYVANVELSVAVSIMSRERGFAAGRPYWSAGRLVVELDGSKRARSLAVFGSDGKLKHRIPVTPGSSRVTLPADVTPGSRALLRVEY